jgi:Flp pilus assembly protein TadG
MWQISSTDSGGFRPRSRLRRRGRCAQRRGAALPELAIVLLVFLTLVFGMFDLAMMLARQQSLAQAARNGCRAAMVRGEYSDVLGKSGPTAYSGTANDSNSIAQAVKSQLLLMDAANVRLSVTWADNGNEVGQRVKVSASADFTPITTFIFGSPTWTFTGSSEMMIAH